MSRVSGRKGLGVKADDLMDKLIEKALEEVGLAACGSFHGRTADGGAADRHRRAALFLLKFTRTSVIAFDFQEALSFEGDTGPYVQYAVVRARSISRKLEEKGDARARFSRRVERRGVRAAAAVGRFLAGAAGGVEGRCGARTGRSRQASRRTLPSTRFRSRRRSTISIISTPIIHEQDREKKVSCCG